MKPIKQTYLIFLIVISLFSLAIYSTYAMFTTELNTEDIVSIKTDIDIDTSLDEYKILTIEPNSYKIFELNIENKEENSKYYGIWYQPLNEEIEKVKAYKLSTSSSLSMDIINIEEQKQIKIVIINNSEKKVTIKLGVETANNTSLNLNEERNLITEEIEEEKIRNQIASEYIEMLYKENNQNIYQEENGDLIYYGLNPNNYIAFNKELWRIIGVFNGKIKLIKNESIGEYPFDNSSNNLKSSEINRILNELYLNNKDGECYNKEYICNFKGSGITEKSKEQLELQSISNEMTSINNINELLISSIISREQFESYITLINLKTYRDIIDKTENQTIKNTWLNKENMLLSTINVTNDNSYTLSIDEEEINYNTSVNTKKQIYPIVQLKEENYIIKGEGTKDNPYILK